MHNLNALVLTVVLATAAPVDLPPSAGDALAAAPSSHVLPPVTDQVDGVSSWGGERWLSGVSIDWQASRQLAVGLVCHLGLISLALADCGWHLADTGDPELLILTPVDSALRGGEPGGPDFRDVRRRSIEERMHSI